MDSIQEGVSNVSLYGHQVDDIGPNFVHFKEMSTGWNEHRGDVKPHVHSNLFQIVFLTKGFLEFHSEKVNGMIKPGSYILIPEYEVHGMSYNEGSHGAIISISQLLLERLFESSPSQLLVINKLQAIRCEHPEACGAEMVRRLGIEMLDRDEPRQQVVEAWLTLVFAEMIDSMHFDGLIKDHGHADAGHFSNFMRLIKHTGTIEKSLTDYAEELGIGTTHLNRICKQTVGKRASEVIRDYIIMEAKRYLRFTSHTISEIAYLLAFSNPSYFNRYFKKEVGMTPKTYRHTKGNY